MKILVGVDDSPHAKAAVQYAAKALWPKGTTFLVLSASPPIFAGAGEATSPTAMTDLIEQQASYHRSLTEKGAATLRSAGLSADGRMVSGDPRDVLVETARSEHIDLLIVGSHGRTGLKKLLLGSVASHVVSHAPCSVLVVKRHSK